MTNDLRERALRAADLLDGDPGFAILRDVASVLREAAVALRAPVVRTDWQQRCLDVGFAYTRAPDYHYVECTQAQAAELLRDVLGVDVYLTPAADDPESLL